MVWLAFFAFAVIGQSDYCGFNFTTPKFQSLYCFMRIHLEAHETEITSVWEYDGEKKTEIQHLKLKKNYCVS